MDPVTQHDDQLNNYREQYSYYARRLLSDLGLGDLGQPERSQLLEALEGYVQQIMVNTLLENLTPEKLDEASEILDRGGDNETVVVHLINQVPEIETKMAQALTEAYARMLSEARQLTQAIVSPTSTEQTPAETE